MKIYSKNIFAYLVLVMIVSSGCSEDVNKTDDVTLITLDPGHFHAALIQKSMFEGVNDSVYVYAPEGNEVEAHLALIGKYNTRVENPTSWKEVIYKGDNYLDKMLEEKKGNVVILAGNNLQKTKYIEKSVDQGLNVLADKPMAIDSKGFELLKTAFEKAKENKVLIYDIMTERYDINNILQKELMAMPGIFGRLEKGSTENPAIIKESVHHFYKDVSGSPLIRPVWYYDVEQEGSGLVDVTTHLVDIIQWTCFNNVSLDYKNDIQMLAVKRWATPISAGQFKKSTAQDTYPDYLLKDVKDGVLNVYSNGEMNYTIKNVHTKVSVVWDFEAPKGGGDTHYSVVKGSKANLVIRQGKAQNYKAVLFIEPIADDNDQYKEELQREFAELEKSYPGIKLKQQESGWEVIVPDSYKPGHEAQFAQVTNKFLEYLRKGDMPAWEVPNMLAKYYTTTSALTMALK